MSDAYPELPHPLLPGYAPKLCPGHPAHYARRDPDTPGITWRCVQCGLTWATPKPPGPLPTRPEGTGPPPQERT